MIHVIFFCAGRTRGDQPHAPLRDIERNIERNDEGKGAVADVLIFYQPRLSRLDRLVRILALQRLNAGDFIIADHQLALFSQVNRLAVEFIDGS